MGASMAIAPLRIGLARGDGVDAPPPTRKRMDERELGTLAAGDVQMDSPSHQLGKHRAFVDAFEDQTKSQRIGSTIF